MEMLSNNCNFNVNFNANVLPYLSVKYSKHENVYLWIDSMRSIYILGWENELKHLKYTQKYFPKLIAAGNNFVFI